MTSRATIRIAALAGLCHAGFASPAPAAHAAPARNPPIAASPSPAVPAAGLSVRAVRFWSLGNSTRIAIEVSADFEYRKDRLDNPNRMFVDIAGAQPRIEGQVEKGQHVIAVGDKFVKQIRVAIPRAGTTRVVLDLEPGVECVTSQLSDPDRLMIEVTVPGRPEVPTVTPSVVGIKRFELPPVTLSRNAAPTPKINFIDDPAPQVSMRTPAATPLPTAKQRRLLASAAAPAPPPPPPPPVAEPEPDPVISATIPANEPPLSVSPSSGFPDGAPLPAKRNTSGDRTMTRVFGLKIKRIVIDAGHGGKDEGTRGPKGLLEKDLVLDVAKRLGVLLSDRLGVEVVFTRSDDTFIPLEQRTAIANDRQGDLFISIHANSSTIRSVSGVEIYYLSFSNSKVDLDTAARENAGAESSVHELETLLQKAMLNDKLKESSEFASKVLQAMAGSPGPPAVAAGPANGKGAAVAEPRGNAKAGVRSRGIRRAPFVVLIGAHMPSVLAEIGFISNPGDEAQMMKSAHRQKIAESLAKGIEEYAQSFSRFQVAERQAGHAAARPAAAASSSEPRP